VPLRPYPEDHPVLQRFGPDKVAASNPKIVALLNAVSQSNIQSTDIWLSTDLNGATGVGSKITRNSYAIGTKCLSGWKCPRDAINYIINQINTMFKSYTPAVIVETRPFRSDMCENLVVTIPGLLNAQRYVIVGAHLDSTMASNTRTDSPAPGADDNGSGSSALLEFARAISQTNQKFDYSIQLQWYCGEEQGLLGSQAIAKQYNTNGVNVIAMFNMDMIGWMWQPPGTPPPPRRSVLAFDSDYVSPTLTKICKDASKLYNPAQEIGDARGCCSDQESFYNYGYQVASIFETPTSTVQYPYYHRETDVYTQVSMSQVYSFAKSFLACIAEHAVPR